MIPSKIILHKIARTVEVIFAEEVFILPCEYLRVFSPSAEVQNHGGPILWVTGKQDVSILTVEPVGNYAVKFIFSDGHRTGIYTWSTLYQLGKNYLSNWQLYLENTNGSRSK